MMSCTAVHINACHLLTSFLCHDKLKSIESTWQPYKIAKPLAPAQRQASRRNSHARPTNTYRSTVATIPPGRKAPAASLTTRWPLNRTAQTVISPITATQSQRPAVTPRLAGRRAEDNAHRRVHRRLHRRVHRRLHRRVHRRAHRRDRRPGDKTARRAERLRRTSIASIWSTRMARTART